MKQFFTILFGGLFAVATGIGIAYGASLVWHATVPLVVSIVGTTTAPTKSHITSTITDHTVITGVTRAIRYTASEEEDLFNAAAQSLPYSPDGRITAQAYILKNLTVGDASIEYNVDRVLPIASLTKLATAVVARRLFAANERILIGPKIMATYGNTASFKSGEIFKAADLMYPLLMVSSNDAAEAFALAYGRDKFIRAMNDWAQSIGAYRTSFEDASGLSPRNVSTVNDLALMLDWIHTNDPAIIDITLMKSKTIRSHTWVNPTHFLSWSYYAGGKNGYTDEADRTSASLFRLGKNRNLYAAITLGSSNRDADVIKLLEKVRE